MVENLVTAGRKSVWLFSSKENFNLEKSWLIYVNLMVSFAVICVCTSIHFIHVISLYDNTCDILLFQLHR